MKFICALMTVNDIQRSRNFYENILNQKVKYDFGENVTFYGGFAIHLKNHFQNLIENKEIKTGCNNFELYFESDNLEQIVEKLKENEVEFIHGIKVQPWKQKVLRFYDPDENIIEIGESMEYLCFRLNKEGFSNKEIKTITGLDEEFVGEVVGKFKD